MPRPGPHEVRLEIEFCGVCRTDLHIVEGDLPPLLPEIVPGHEAVARVAELGPEVRTLAVGDRVGMPWLRFTCGRCEYCRTGRENLCAFKRFTGYSDPGGYAEQAVADEGYLLRLPPGPGERLAPLLCAGIIGYRAFTLARPRPGGRIGFFGFGGSAHLTLQLAARLGYETVAYSRDPAHVALARSLGAVAAYETPGGIDAPGPADLDAAIVFAPAGEVVLQALGRLKRGGTVAVAGIHVSPIPPIDYDGRLFGERVLRSVEANTRQDAEEFLALATRLGVESHVTVRPLGAANEALRDLKEDRVVGAAVLECRAR